MRMESPLNQRLRWSPPDVVYTPIDVTSPRSSGPRTGRLTTASRKPFTTPSITWLSTGNCHRRCATSDAPPAPTRHRRPGVGHADAPLRQGRCRRWRSPRCPRRWRRTRHDGPPQQDGGCPYRISRRRGDPSPRQAGGLALPSLRPLPQGILPTDPILPCCGDFRQQKRGCIQRGCIQGKRRGNPPRRCGAGKAKGPHGRAGGGHR